MKETEDSPSEPFSSRNGCLWLFLISLGSITYLTGYYFVPTLQTRGTELVECPITIYNFLSYSCKDFDINTHPILAMEISGVTPSHGFIALEAVPILPKGSNIDKVFIRAEINIFAVTESRNIVSVIASEKDKMLTFSHAEKDQKDYYPQSFGMISQPKDGRYIFVIKLLNTDDIQAKQVQDIKMGFITQNPTFEQHLLYFKAFLFSVAIISWVQYAMRISKLPSGSATSEQAIVNIMGFTLILFDQPFLSPSFFAANFPLLTGELTVIAIQTSAIIAVWFSTLERLSSNTNTISSLGKWYIGIFTTGHFVLIMTAYGTLSFDQMKDPLLDFHSDPSLGVTLCRYYLYVVVGIGSLWTIVRTCQILGKRKDLDWRDNSAFTFSFYYIICYILFLLTGSLQIIATKGVRTVLLYGITTLYSVLLQIIHAPFDKDIEEEKRRAKYDNKKVKSQYDDLNLTDLSGTKIDKDTHQLRVSDQLQVASPAHADEEEDEEQDEGELAV